MTKTNTKIDAVILPNIKQLDLTYDMIMDATKLARFLYDNDQAVNKPHRLDLAVRTIKDAAELASYLFHDLKSYRRYLEIKGIQRGATFAPSSSRVE
ncbi:MAG: hypothetical protein ACLPKB_19820 [Xanthobacteraceae bacterium]